GAAADRFGRRVLFLPGVITFTLASIGCGCAPEIATLIGARAVQGVGAALLIPCSLAIIGAAFDEQERGAAIGIWSGASALAAGAGPLLGGWLVDHLSWRAIFLINPLIAIPTLWIAVRRLPESADPAAHAGLDWRGAALVRRPGRPLWRAAPAHQRAAHRGRRFCAARRAQRRAALLGLPRAHDRAGLRHGHHRRAAHDYRHQLRHAARDRRGLRHQQC